MKVRRIFDGIIDGRLVVVKWVLRSPFCEHPSEMVFSPDVTAYADKWYDVHVSGLYAMEILAALGYDNDDRLSDVISFAKKLHNIIPDDWDCNQRDNAGDIIRHVMSVIADDHEGEMVDNASYNTVLEHPLRGRPYLQRLVQQWDPDDDIRRFRRRYLVRGAERRQEGGISSSPLRGVSEVVDMAADFALTDRRLIEQAHELARKRDVLFTRVSAMVEELKRLREEVDKAAMRAGVAVSKAEAAERTIVVLREEVARLEQQLAMHEGESQNSGPHCDDYVSTVQSPGVGEEGPSRASPYP
ncbi:hypothetical protein CBR_g679 [Chara braunii]|uniref:Uncharacterized protein n=1 Tax=Chara braunii TaxID=69332 RepID=A0A388KBW1_CHABU|nr:hypothetical protein CBR_g679 [Chara braunii]|eukprot:GBG67548.1 hypothetical protein CBR_g679 [Chara braunii]